METNNANAAVVTRSTAKKRKKRGPAGEIWWRFRKSPSAMIGLVIVVFMILIALLADVIAPSVGINPAYDIQDLNNRFQPPSLEHLMGTDDLGRDVLARVVHGSRTSLSVGALTVTASMIVGSLLGLIAGYFGRYADNIIMRFVDVILSIPAVLLAISISAALEPGFTTIIIAIGIGAAPIYARVMRASVLSIREQEFVEAARAIGASNFRIIFKHILPNCMAPIIVQGTMGIGYAILWTAALGFFGLGIQPPTPEWGTMLAGARQHIRDHSHMVFFPGLSIAMVIIALNMMGDGLRDAFDPRLKR